MQRRAQPHDVSRAASSNQRAAGRPASRGAGLLRQKYRIPEDSSVRARIAPPARVRWRFLFLVSATALPPACQSGDTVSAVGMVADSSGVQVFDYSAVTGNTPPVVELGEPLFRVGWREGDPLFVDVSAGAILTDSSVVVGDRGRSVIMSLSSTGVLRYQFGRPGDGPGEFREVSTLVASGGDSVVVQDMSLARLTNVAPSGELGWVAPLPPNPSAGPLYHEMIAYRPSGGLFAPDVFSPTKSPRDKDGWIEMPVLVWHHTAQALDTVAVVARAFRPLAEGVPVYPPVELLGLAVATDSGWVYARTDKAEVQWRNSTGRLLRIVRWAQGDQRLSRTAIGNAVDQQVERMESSPEGGKVAAARLRRHLESEYAKGSFVAPVITGLAADESGIVWLAEFEPARRDSTRFLIAMPTGSLAGRVTVQGHTDILAARSGLLLTLERSHLDEQAVALYRIPAALWQPSHTQSSSGRSPRAP